MSLSIKRLLDSNEITGPRIHLYPFFNTEEAFVEFFPAQDFYIIAGELGFFDHC